MFASYSALYDVRFAPTPKRLSNPASRCFCCCSLFGGCWEKESVRVSIFSRGQRVCMLPTVGAEMCRLTVVTWLSQVVAFVSMFATSVSCRTRVLRYDLIGPRFRLDVGVVLLRCPSAKDYTH